MKIDTIEAYPLAWPVGWPRVRHPGRSRFKGRSLILSIDEVHRQLRSMGVYGSRAVISSNVELRLDGLPYSNRRRPQDCGVALYFQLKGNPIALACDKWDSPEDNLWAISKHMEALRGQERWGVGSLAQAFSGYAQLQERNTEAPTDWWRIFDVSRDANESTVRAARAVFVKDAHRNNDGPRLTMLQSAWQRFKDSRSLV